MTIQMVLENYSRNLEENSSGEGSITVRRNVLMEKFKILKFRKADEHMDQCQ